MYIFIYYGESNTRRHREESKHINSEEDYHLYFYINKKVMGGKIERGTLWQILNISRK